MRARREEEARKKVAEDARADAARARTPGSGRPSAPRIGPRPRGCGCEGEERLKDLANVDPAAWPWAKWMYAVRDARCWCPPGGEAPVYEGLRIAILSPWNPEKLQHAEFGRVKGTAIRVRERGSANWSEQSLEKVAALGIRPEAPGPGVAGGGRGRGGRNADRVGPAAQRKLADARLVLGVGCVARARVGEAWLGGGRAARHGDVVVRRAAARAGRPRRRALRVGQGRRSARARCCHRRTRGGGDSLPSLRVRPQVPRARGGRQVVVGSPVPRATADPRVTARGGVMERGPVLLLVSGLAALGLLALGTTSGTRRRCVHPRKGTAGSVGHRVRSASEGKADSLNRNLDGAGLSYGILQWNQRSGSLGVLLAAMQGADPPRSRRCSGRPGRRCSRPPGGEDSSLSMACSSGSNPGRADSSLQAGTRRSSRSSGGPRGG